LGRPSRGLRAKVALENGLVLTGEAFGADGEATGELVFNTSLTGYQEILTDPSYCGQIVTMTSPLMGNTGINPDDMEGIRPHVSGFVVKEYSDHPSNFRASQSLGEWLAAHKIMAIQGVDTRMVTRCIREAGAMRAIISTQELEDECLLEKARASPFMAGQDLTKKVTCREPFQWTDVDSTPFALPPRPPPPGSFPRGRPEFHVVVYDFGVKFNILRRLAAYGCRITVVPSDYPPEHAINLRPDGILLSNGPGDPAAATYAIQSVKELIGKTPLFGICLGHQLLALALGGKTYKLKFGHRGGNHPVKNLLTGGIEITSQNHGFAIDPQSLNTDEIEFTHVNLNDGTNEGLRHRALPLFSVQYHPEASPGPRDSDYLFTSFMELMNSRRSEGGIRQPGRIGLP
jgi:carbamoyl-phosphate synthase small subunit